MRRAAYITLYYAADSNLYLHVKHKPPRLTAATQSRKAQGSVYFRQQTDTNLGFVWSGARALGWDSKVQDPTAVGALWLCKIIVFSLLFPSRLIVVHSTCSDWQLWRQAGRLMICCSWSAQGGSHFQMDITDTSVTSTNTHHSIMNYLRTPTQFAGVATQPLGPLTGYLSVWRIIGIYVFHIFSFA